MFTDNNRAWWITTIIPSQNYGLGWCAEKCCPGFNTKSLWVGMLPSKSPPDRLGNISMERLTHVHTYANISIYIYMCILFICFYECVDMWREASETPPFPVFLFFFFFNLFCKIQSRCWEEKGHWRRMSSKSRGQQQCLLARFWVGVITWRTSEEPGKKWPWDRDSGNRAVPGLHTLGRKPIPPTHPKTFEHGEEQFGIWQATKGTVPHCKHNAESLTMPERLTTGD